jgi:cell division topological specificity factor
MSGFFERFLNRGKEQKSAQSAKERLQFVLIHDRINLPPERLQQMKEEILAVISKYVDVAAGDVDIALEQRERNKNMLVAEIPFSKSRKFEEQPGAAADEEKSDKQPTATTATSTDETSADENSAAGTENHTEESAADDETDKNKPAIQ